jgi:TonB-linked SusC/RagA family outer membrane protein
MQLIEKICRIMRLVAFIMLILVLHVSATTSGQISITATNASLADVFKKIEASSSYSFVYRDEWLKESQKVSLNVQNASIDDVLALCFKNQPLTYTIVSNTIVIREKPAVNEESYAVDLQSDLAGHEIQGSVVNQDGIPVPGVSVTVMGSSVSTLTDEKGYFKINNVDPKTVLVFTAVNIEKQEVKVGNQTNISLTLKIKRSILDDVQVIGYGSTSRRLNTGSMGSVTSEEIENQPVVNPLMAIEGRVAGVEMTVSSGEPGSPIDVKIRGENTSFAATSYPLFIVDGVQMPYNTGYSYVASNPLNSINPGDIESISILKDADATAVYGSRGANGVVLITTKKGKAGATTLNVDMSTGFSQASRLMKGWLNTPEYLNIRKQAFAAEGTTPTINNAPDLLLWSQTAYTDWQKEVLGNTGNYSNVQASLSGGDDRVRYLISGAYNYSKGIVWGDSYEKRANFHANIENNSRDKRFQMSTSFTYSNDNFRKSGDNFYLPNILKTPPNLPHYDSAGEIYYVPDNAQIDNPLFYLNQYTTNNTDNFLASSKMSYLILQNLKLTLSVGYTKQTQSGFQADPSTSLNPASFAGFRTNYANYLTGSVGTFVTEPQIDYNTNISKGKLQMMAGGTWQSTQSANSFIGGYNYSSDALLGNIGAASAYQNASSDNSTYKYESVFIRANYNWQDKYLLNGSFRRDGSSRFGAGYKFGNFWSAGAAWIFTNESFFKNGAGWLSFGKLRGSYGLTGNDQIGDYQYLSFYSPTTNVYNGISSIYSSQVQNSSYRWEQTYKGDIGIELGALGSRILLTVDYFNNKSQNLLTAIPLPSQAGYANYTGNLPAIVQNKGWEFTLNTVNIKSRDFKWSTSFNLTLPKNILLSFPGLDNSIYANTYEIGKSIRLVKEFKYAGISETNGAPLFYTATGTITDGTATGGGVLNYPGDLAYIGNLDPRSFGGLGNIFDYKGFELNIFFQYSYSSTTNSLLGTMGYPVGAMRNTAEFLTNGVSTGKGQTAPLPALATSASTFPGGNFTNYSFNSSANFVSNSYIRLKTLALTWSMPAGWSRNLKLSNVQIYAQAQNLFTITNYDYLDPEAQVGIPILKTITFGLRASL